MVLGGVVGSPLKDQRTYEGEMSGWKQSFREAEPLSGACRITTVSTVS